MNYQRLQGSHDTCKRLKLLGIRRLTRMRTPLVPATSAAGNATEIRIQERFNSLNGSSGPPVCGTLRLRIGVSHGAKMCSLRQGSAVRKQYLARSQHHAASLECEPAVGQGRRRRSQQTGSRLHQLHQDRQDRQSLALPHSKAPPQLRLRRLGIFLFFSEVCSWIMDYCFSNASEALLMQ